MNLLKCKTCNTILTSEQVQKHTMCYINQTKSKKVYASHISILKNDDDENCVLVTGLDGVTYSIIEKRPNFVEYLPDFNADQPKGNTTNNYRGGNSTFR